jgi:hypothetical protein
LLHGGLIQAATERFSGGPNGKLFMIAKQQVLTRLANA